MGKFANANGTTHLTVDWFYLPIWKDREQVVRNIFFHYCMYAGRKSRKLCARKGSGDCVIHHHPPMIPTSSSSITVLSLLYHPRHSIHILANFADPYTDSDGNRHKDLGTRILGIESVLTDSSSSRSCWWRVILSHLPLEYFLLMYIYWELRAH